MEFTWEEGLVSSFTKSYSNGVVLWTGDPDCQAGHDAILMWLARHTSSFLPTPLPLNNRLKGNLGEAITFCVGHWHDLSDYKAYPANALKPLSNISRPDIDIVWVQFGNTSADDILVLQEVKTTSAPNLTLADELITDYDKLFGKDITLTLHSRLQAIKNTLEYQEHRPDLCPRLSELAGQSPQSSQQAYLRPTLVYELNGSSPVTKMVAVRAALHGTGWSSRAVEAWAIGLSDLDARLVRLATGQP